MSGRDDAGAAGPPRSAQSAQSAESAESAPAALAAAAVDLMLEVGRRDAGYFARSPLRLPPDEPLPALAPAGPSLRDLLVRVAAGAGVPVRDGRPGEPPGLIDGLLRDGLRRLGSTHFDAACATAGGWQRQVDDAVASRLAAQAGAVLPRLSALPGWRRRQTAGGVNYVRVGDGPRALLLVNAFGLSLDFWAGLAAPLAGEFTLLAVTGAGDDDADPGDDAPLPATYYGAADALLNYLAAVPAVLAAEGHSRCAVASWCSGAKYAIELARRRPGVVSSLSLFAPSFAGVPSAAGGDSAFESSLQQMCTLVDRLPQAAGSMAKSMTAMMAKGAAGGDAVGDAAGDAAVLGRADAAMLPWLYRPYSSASRMRDYSRQLVAFRSHGLARQPPLAMPVLLATGECDSATCSRRALEVCGAMADPLAFELRGASHYFIAQNPALAAGLLRDFVTGAMPAAPAHPRWRPLRANAPAPVPAEPALVSGEL